MSIDRRPDGKWRARWREVPGGPQQTRHFDLKGEAQDFLKGIDSDLHQGVYVDPNKGKVSFREVADQWLAESVHLKPKTIAGYESVLARHVLPKWGAVPINRIDRSAVKAWVATMTSEGVGAGTIKNVVNVTSAVFRSAIEAGALKVNPCSGLRLSRTDRAPMRFLTAEEIERLAETIKEHYRVLVIFAAYSGLRAGEIAALRWENVDTLRGVVTVAESYAEVRGALVLGPTKTYARRTVALPRFLIDMLSPTKATGLVFEAPEGGPIRQSNFYRRTFVPACVEAGLGEYVVVEKGKPPRYRGCRFHDLRHSTVALLIAQGAHPLAIKERLGHSSITVTLDQYGHLLPSLDEALTEGLDATRRAAAEDRLRTRGDSVVSIDARKATV